MSKEYILIIRIFRFRVQDTDCLLKREDQLPNYPLYITTSSLPPVLPSFRLFFLFLHDHPATVSSVQGDGH